MKKLFILILVTTATLFTSCKDRNKPEIPDVDLSQSMGKGELFQRLITIPSVSDIKAVKGAYHSANFDEEYQFYIEQQIDPNNPSVGTFKQKVRIGHVGFDKNVVLVTEGYALEDKDSVEICQNSFDHTFNDADYIYQGEEIANYLKANMVVVEHRYFYTSNPDVRNWDYLTTKNASADLHHIYQTIKPLYKKPWVSTGVSKGGMTTMFYHMMYPNDVEVCVPYVAPMCYGLADDRARDYIKEHAADPETREKIVACKNWVLEFMYNNQELVFNEYCNQWQDDPESNEILEELIANVISFDVDMWNYSNNWAIDIMPTAKEEYKNAKWIVNWCAKIQLTLNDKYGAANTDTHFEIINPAEFEKSPQRVPVYDVDKTTNEHNKRLPYSYMAAHEQRQPLRLGTDDINVPEEWKSICEQICAPNTKELLNTIKGFPGSFPDYTPDLYNQCINYYQTHDDRVIFIYGKNDFWTGCGINDVWKTSRSDRTKYPTFFDGKQQMAYYIVPNRGHNCNIFQLPANEVQEVWNKIDTWLANPIQNN